MGIDWMTYDQLSQAIPPAYTEHIGWQLLQHRRCPREASTTRARPHDPPLRVRGVAIPRHLLPGVCRDA